MADIANELNAISAAKYGEEVRGSIVNAINKINDVVNESEVSDLVNISTPFVDKIYKNEILYGYDTSDLTISGLQLGSNANFVTLIIPIRFNLNIRSDSYIEFPFESAKRPNGCQTVLFDSDWKIIGNYYTRPSNDVVRIDFSKLNKAHELAHFAFSTTGPLYKIKYHNVLDSTKIGYDLTNYDPFIVRTYPNTFIASYNPVNKEPNITAHRENFTSLVIAVNPSKKSRLQFTYHNEEGILAGKAQILYLDDSFKVITNKTVAEQSRTCTITFDTSEQQSASYVMFSTNGSLDSIRYYNVLDSSMMNTDDFESDFLDFGIFRSIACLGDSYTQGAIANSAGNYLNGDKQNPWPNIIAQRFGIHVDNYGVGGSTTKSYWTNELSKVLSGTKPDGYFYCWGINDSSNDKYHVDLWDNTTAMEHLGSASDIVDSESDVPNNTFYGYYSSIIMKCKAYAPSALHTIIVMPITGNYSDTVSYRNATIEIANSLGIPYMNPMDDQFFFSDAYNNMNTGHPTRLGYVGMARAFTRLFSKCVTSHVSYYKNVVIG